MKKYSPKIDLKLKRSGNHASPKITSIFFYCWDGCWHCAPVFGEALSTHWGGMVPFYRRQIGITQRPNARIIQKDQMPREKYRKPTDERVAEVSWSTCCNKARDIPLKARAYETTYFYEVRLKRVRVVPAACTSLFRSTLHFIIVQCTYRMTNEISLVWAWSLQDKVNRIHAETLAQSCGSKSASIGTPVGMCPYIGFGFGTEGIQFQWLSNGARPGNIKFTAVCSMWLLKLRFSGLDQQEKAVQKPQTSRGEEPPVKYF